MTSTTTKKRPGLRRRLRLSRKIMDGHYTQPATALWRVPEVEVVQDHLRGTGDGLDLGCGDGTLAKVLLEKAGEIRWSGLDLDPRDAEAGERSGMYERVHVAPASEIPLENASVDLVFSNSALEHMVDLDRVVEEVARVVRPGGHFVFTVPVPAIHTNLLWARTLRVLGLKRAAGRYTDHLDRRLAHINFLSEDDWERELTRVGFEVEKTVSYLTRCELSLWEMLANATGGLAYLLMGGKKSPREIQQSLGIDRPSNSFLATVVSWFLAPAIVLSTFGRRRSGFSGLYLEARRTADSSPTPEV